MDGSAVSGSEGVVSCSDPRLVDRAAIKISSRLAGRSDGLAVGQAHRLCRLLPHGQRGSAAFSQKSRDEPLAFRDALDLDRDRVDLLLEPLHPRLRCWIWRRGGDRT